MIKLVNLLEKKGDKYECGCLYLYFKFPYIKQIHNLINSGDLYTEEDDKSYGLEDEPHITLLYGIDKDVEFEKIKKLVRFIHLPVFEIYNVSCFENEDYDVLKFDTKGGKFDKIHNKLKENIPHIKNEHEYHPHMTICYLKKGVVNKYINKFKDLEFKIQPIGYLYSMADGTKKKFSSVSNSKNKDKWGT